MVSEMNIKQNATKLKKENTTQIIYKSNIGTRNRCDQRPVVAKCKFSL